MSAPPPRRPHPAPHPAERPPAPPPRRLLTGAASTREERRPRRWIVAASALALVAAIAVVVTVWASGSAPAGAEREPAASVPSTTPTASIATPAPTPTAAAPPTSPDSTAATALALLSGLATVDGYADVPYDRDRFGQPWTDVDRNGCDTRNDILGRDLLDPVFKPGTSECKVLAGLLIDPYDGTHIDFVSGPQTSVLVQIDHVVALGWAWHRGAAGWTDELRTAFANDPLNLVAASEATNQEKSAFGPSEWLPPARELRCGYVENWVAVLAAYDLGVDGANRAAAEAVLRDC